MTFLELARRRVSVRGYRETAVSDEELRAVVEAGRLAPSAANRQPWHFVVVRAAERRRALGRAYGKDWFWEAPVILVLCLDPSAAWERADGKTYADVDGAIAMDHMTLCAADLGLGTCWIGAFEPGVVREVLALPDGIEPLAMTPLGHPADEGRPKTRKPLAEILHTEQW